MPLLKIKTNVILASKLEAIKGLTNLLAETLGKPEKFVQIVIEDNVLMTFGGDASPTLYAELYSLGLKEDETEHYTQELCHYFADNFAVATERVYIQFGSPERHMWGWNGKTFNK